MANTKNDVAQQATRWFLTALGEQYDLARSLHPFRPTPTQWREVLEFFGSECAYCGLSIDDAQILKDHLIPLNRVAGGLHAWGNVVPSCRPCNDSKGSDDWREWLSSKQRDDVSLRIYRLERFASHYGYSLQGGFAADAEQLYRQMLETAERVVLGAVANAITKLPMQKPTR